MKIKLVISRYCSVNNVLEREKRCYEQNSPKSVKIFRAWTTRYRAMLALGRRTGYASLRKETSRVQWISKNRTVDHHRGYNCFRSTTLAARWQDTAPVTPTIAQITIASFLQP
ncbi:hypothetical protein M422DRAFT_32451 [Sphaerobolus stellatus SS14]|uniref:Uncharacterized protein n=1 Tax=Sphaerobolus stellatus (strain SS14) TaxID=990650 RepID=A0A0C9VF89_SPHS4|nr:hypothetical protein M422DRAFT_32451 [Sphaerobolus stellatus SS14]